MIPEGSLEGLRCFLSDLWGDFGDSRKIPEVIKVVSEGSLGGFW